jgi:hydroxyacylglutathione hydrolase
MREVADGVHLLRGFPPAAFNVYVIRSEHGWVLVDTGSKFARRRIARQVPGELEAIFVTHAHRDHAGSMHSLARATGAPVWASAADADPLEGRAPEPFPREYANHPANRLLGVVWKWDSHPVARRVGQGDSVAGFEVVAFPGHTPGQVGLWRASDRTVICADTMRNINFFTGLPQLGELPVPFTCDRAEARRSIRRLAALEPRVVCFGHGRPLTEGSAEKINAFAAALPAEHPTP